MLTPSQAELSAWLRLSEEPEIGPVLAAKLMQVFGPPEQLYATPRQVLAQHLPAPLAIQLSEPASPATVACIERALAWGAQDGHHLLSLADARYPAALLETHDPPLLLYVLGDAQALSRPTLAIVGARHATPGGAAMAQDFARTLAARGWCIASGLALGIDAAAHRGALSAEAGATVAVVGTGADIVYPARHRELAHRIAAGGAIVSELPLGTTALPHHFPRRNRLVAGLSRGVLVVEAAVHSGSLITARLAADMGREVFAIPGSIHSPLSRGCHALIRQGAKLVETAQDVLDELDPLSSMALAAAHPAAALRRDDPARHHHGKAGNRPPDMDAAPAASGRADPPAQAEDALLRQLGFDPLNIDEVQQRSGLAADTLQVRLLTLELEGRIARLPGARIQRLN